MLRLRLAGLSVLAGLAFASAAGAQTTPNLKSLHDALHLTSSQEPAWTAYQASVMQPQAQQRRRAAALLFPNLTAPRRVDLVEAEMQQDLADLRRQGAALKTFYVALTPAQQRVFDAQTLPPQPGRGGDDDN